MFPVILFVGLVAGAYYLSQRQPEHHEITEAQAKVYIAKVIKNKKRTRADVEKAYQLALKYKMNSIAGKLHMTLDNMKT